MHPRGIIAGIIALTLALAVLGGLAGTARAADTPEPNPIDRTPPRLSFTDGQVSFWRPGAQDWAQAQVNTPLAPGDELATGSPGNLEVQVGARAFVRAWANSQLGLVNQEPDFLQFKVTAGYASFDLRTLEPGTMVEIDTPHAAFTIEHPGYYRVDVLAGRTSFITRRGGRATVAPANGEALAITSSEEVVIEGPVNPQVASYAAPPLDDWDKWNYARSDRLVDAVSARHVSPGMYGVSDLDPYGTWRVVPSYGSIWVPTAIPSGWVPYSTGAWVLDPLFGWTWVDTAPWGWAPYHYGRWVFVDGFWAWAPGPVLVRPVYAPALVAFFGEPSVGVSIGPVVGWVALGWGEPIVPWWGPSGFVHVPSWRGWGGPRVVNNVVINNTTVVNVQNISVYRNASVQNAVVAVSGQRFGRGPVTSARLVQANVSSLQPIHAAPAVTATPASFVPTATRGIRPPEEILKRAVVATRPPQGVSEAVAGGGERRIGPAGIPTPAPRLVSVPPQREVASVPPRPPFGRGTVERPMTDRSQPPAPPALESPRRPERGAPGTPSVRPAPQRREPSAAVPPPGAPQPPVRRAEESPVSAVPPTSRRAETPPLAVPAPPGHRTEAPPMTAAPSPRRAEAPPVPAPPAPGRRVEPPGATAPPLPTRRAEAPPATVAPTPSRRPEAPPAVTPPPPARRPESPAVAAPPAPSRRAEGPGVAAPAPGGPPPSVGRPGGPRPPAHPLPGEAANRLSPNRVQGEPGQPGKPGG